MMMHAELGDFRLEIYLRGLFGERENPRRTPTSPRSTAGASSPDACRRARQRGVETSAEGATRLSARDELPDLVLEAISARAHLANGPRYAEAGIQAVDLIPAALGPLVWPGCPRQHRPGRLFSHIGLGFPTGPACGRANWLMVPGYGSRMYFPANEGFITLQVKPATG
jgi:hypothetical protein